jgi:hypothetical protein
MRNQALVIFLCASQITVSNDYNFFAIFSILRGCMTKFYTNEHDKILSWDDCAELIHDCPDDTGINLGSGATFYRLNHPSLGKIGVFVATEGDCLLVRL